MTTNAQRKELARLVVEGLLTETEAAQIIIGVHHGSEREAIGRAVRRQHEVPDAVTAHSRRGREDRYRDLLARLDPTQTVQPVQPRAEVQVSLMPQRRTPRALRATFPRGKGKPDMRDYSVLKYKGPTPSADFDWDAALLRFALMVRDMGYTLSPEQRKRIDDHA